MSIDPECESEWLSREHLDSSHEKKGSVGRVSSGEDIDSVGEAVNALDGH